MESNFCNEKFLEEYNSFLNQLEKLFEEESDKEVVRKLMKECESDKLSRGSAFYNSIESDNMFELFCRSKVRVFSTKDESTSLISNSLFGDELPLKKLINNQSQKTKDTIWKFLHLFYFLQECENKNRSERKSKISKVLKEKKRDLTEEVKNELLDVDVNEDTNDMINDIVKSFEKTLSGENANPFESIMEITQQITEKYNSKIESGEIELDKLMSSIQSSIPGMPNMMGGLGGLGAKKEPKEKVIIDEEFSTDKVELGDKDKQQSGSGMNLGNMLNMMNSMNKMGGDGGEGGPNLGGLFSMLSKIDNIDNEEDAEKLKQEMDSYLEKELGVDVSKLNEQIEEAQKKMGAQVEELSDNDSAEEPDQD